jgi:hypothetical protein
MRKLFTLAIIALALMGGVAALATLDSYPSFTCDDSGCH